MKTAGRYKRVAGAIGLITAVGMGTSGCQLIPGMGEKGVRGNNKAGIELNQEYIAAYGNDRKAAEPVMDAGINALALMYDDFPQYTVTGFTPTDENLDEVVTAFKPVSTDGAVKRIETEFAKDKSLPVMTSHRSGRGEGAYTSTLADGQKCTESSTPYDVAIGLINLSVGEDKTPAIIAQAGITVHCQEGYRMALTMRTTFDLVQQDGKWLLADNYTAEVSKEMPVQIIK